MLNNNSLQSRQQKMISAQSDMHDLKRVIHIITSRWYIFSISLILALICAYLYIYFTIPSYRVSSSILIEPESNGFSVKNDQLLQGFGLSAGMKNLDNQMNILSSRTLIGETLDDLDLYYEYYHSGLFNHIALFPNSPIKVIPLVIDSVPKDIEFTFKYLDNNRFIIDVEPNDNFELHRIAFFGDVIETPEGQFKIEATNGTWPLEYIEGDIKIMIHSRKKLIEKYKGLLKIEPISKMGTTVNLSIEGTNRAMNIDFLNKLTEIFLNNSLDKKNEEAIRITAFIDDQLIGISDSLFITETKLQQFRSRNKVMDLSAQGAAIISQAMKLENEKARLDIESNYYDYLAEYLAKDSAGLVPIAPATMGITDPGLTRLVAELAELQGQLYSHSLGEKNPLQNQLVQKVYTTKRALKETLNGLRRANDLARDETQTQIRNTNASATVLPVTERQLLGIERKFKLNDALYTFLLEKRSEAQIQKASNMPDNEIIDLAEADSYPASPRSLLIYLFAIMAGAGIPFLVISISDVLNNKLRTEEEIKNITPLPVIGHIPHNSKKMGDVFSDPGSILADAFRSLRSRLQFFMKESKSSLILVTSSMPGEGKSFTAINLASAYSLMGKRTILIDFDLRKPSIHEKFNLSNDSGFSTWYIGNDGINEIIQKIRYQNLSVIPSGPIPPNPAELLASEKTIEFISYLRERYECVIIDSAPIGVVPDIFQIASFADTCIIIIKFKKTVKSMLINTIRELENIKVKSLSLVLNDISPKDSNYNYRGKYNYYKMKNGNVDNADKKEKLKVGLK